MKKIAVILLCCIQLLSITGCFLIEPQISDEEIILQQQEILRFGFSSEYETLEKVLTLDELLAWTNPYESYSSYYFYKTLNTEEQYIYHALEYAMVNSYEFTNIDSKINILTDRCNLIVQYLAVDTPLLEQNVISSCSANHNNKYDYAVDENRVVSVPLYSKKIQVNNFRPEQWKKKMSALEEAEKVFAQFKKHDTDIELAEEIYRYVAKNIEYIPYENENGFYRGHLSPFLHDAFINKKTHCDGFANALALLFAMAGFEQVEKEGYNDEIGHTWNCVKLDGVWYNCDATAESWIPKKSTSMGAGPFFAFSDQLVAYEQKWSDKYPACEKSYYMNPSGTAKNLNGNEFYNIARKGFAEHKEWSLVIVESVNEKKLSKQLNRLANAYSRTVYCYQMDMMNGKRIILITKKDVFD